MKLIDINVLVYAANSSTAHHTVVRDWWQRLLQSGESVAMPWMVVSGFVRISTNPKAVPKPATPAEAIACVEGWLALPTVQIVSEPTGFLATFAALTRDTPATGNLVTDAHLAAIAIGHDATLASCDSDFARFEGLRWENPLAA